MRWKDKILEAIEQLKQQGLMRDDIYTDMKTTIEKEDPSIGVSFSCEDFTPYAYGALWWVSGGSKRYTGCIFGEAHGKRFIFWWPTGWYAKMKGHFPGFSLAGLKDVELCMSLHTDSGNDESTLAILCPRYPFRVPFTIRGNRTGCIRLSRVFAGWALIGGMSNGFSFEFKPNGWVRTPENVIATFYLRTIY